MRMRCATLDKSFRPILRLTDQGLQSIGVMEAIMMRKRGFMLCLALLFLAGCGGRSLKALDYVQLGEYKGLPVERMSDAVTDEMLEQQLEKYTASGATLEQITDRDQVQAGDVANIDYEGFMDEVAFAGGTGTNHDLTIGSGQFIPGFEDQLIGAHVGETVDVNVSFPDPYLNNPDLAGRPALFRVKINYISRSVTPELTDEMILSVTDGQYGTVEEFKDYLRTQMQTTLASYADSTMNTALMNQVMDGVIFTKEIPKEYLEEEKQSMIRNAKSNAFAYGVSYEQYLQQYLNMDEATFLQTLDATGEEMAKQDLVIRAIAEVENIVVTEEEFSAQVQTALSAYGYKNEKDMFANVSEEDFRKSMLLEKVQKFLAENAEITQK